MSSLDKREPVLFLIATYLFTGLAWGTLILLKKPPTASAITFVLYLLGGLSPTIIALLLPLRAAKGERKAYYKRYFNFKISIKWYVVPVAIGLFMIFAAFAVVQIFYKQTVQNLTLLPWYMIFALFLQMIIGGGLEELGWRGILVHNFQNKNIVLVSLIIGSIWAFWHIPLFFIEGVSQYQQEFLPFFVQVIGLSFVTAVLYIRSQSVVPCVIFHALMNAMSGMGFDQGANTASLITKLVIIAAFVVAFGRKAPKTESIAQEASIG